MSTQFPLNTKTKVYPSAANGEENKAVDETANKTAYKAVNEPSHRDSLLSLNDDCLYEMFAYIVDWRQLYTLSKVCKRFKALVSTVAHFNHTNESASTSLWDVECYLRVSGSSLRRVYVHAEERQSNMLAVLFSKYCANIRELSINIFDEDTKSEAAPLLNGLQKLRWTTRIIHRALSQHSKLEAIEISEGSDDIPPVHMPDLIELCVLGYRSTGIGLGQFLRLNPQIEIVKYIIQDPLFVCSIF